jgi:low affinity Fe/Cu permease
MAKGQNGTRSIAVRPSQAERRVGKIFADIAKVVSRETGRPWVFALAVGTVIVWAVTGPIFNFSDAWQLVINTGTTIVTFLMVFLIQNSQNRDSAAIQVKLDELIRVSEAHNSFVGLERLTGEELEELSQKCAVRALQEIDAVRTRRAARKQ